MGIDIFCQVLDNFGDIGICWRLAKQLRQRTSGPIRLWVDELERFKQIEPDVSLGVTWQQLNNITIIQWQETLPLLKPHALVIEAFGCQLPAPFIRQMAKQNSLWINLEYFSAETWALQWHGLPSLQPGGANKYVFFPGLSSKSGGLLREPDLQKKRLLWQNNLSEQQNFLKQLTVAPKLRHLIANGALQVFLFCYNPAPITGLINALATREEPAVVLIPRVLYDTLSNLLKQANADQVYLAPIPFITQDDFDKLLWSSHLNIVRGEDSFARALWAAKPFIWHIYPQDNDAHLVKLNAWLHDYDFPALNALNRAWSDNNDASVAQYLSELFKQTRWDTWAAHAAQYSDKLMQQDDLVTRLLSFSRKHATAR